MGAVGRMLTEWDELVEDERAEQGEQVCLLIEAATRAEELLGAGELEWYLHQLRGDDSE